MQFLICANVCDNMSHDKGRLSAFLLRSSLIMLCYTINQLAQATFMEIFVRSLLPVREYFHKYRSDWARWESR